MTTEITDATTTDGTAAPTGTDTDRDDRTGGDPFEEALTGFFGPGPASTPWPDSLPEGLRWDDNAGLDEHAVVVPSWNSAPLRKVVRSGRTVAVVDVHESDEVGVVAVEEFPTEDAAREAFERWFDEACADAREAFDELPEELKERAAV